MFLLQAFRHETLKLVLIAMKWSISSNGCNKTNMLKNYLAVYYITAVDDW